MSNQGWETSGWDDDRSVYDEPTRMSSGQTPPQPQTPYGYSSGSTPYADGYPAHQPYPYPHQSTPNPFPVQPTPGFAPGFAPGTAGMAGPWPGRVDPYTGEPLSDKSKIAAGLLQFFLGWLGVGRFYIGDTTVGAIQLGMWLFGMVTLIFGIGFLVLMGLSLWAFVDAILMWTGSVRDGNGRKLSP